MTELLLLLCVAVLVALSADHEHDAQALREPAGAHQKRHRLGQVGVVELLLERLLKIEIQPTLVSPLPGV